MDTGDAFDGFPNLRLKPSAGAGVRINFPQLDRTVMRLDLGVPFVRDVNGRHIPPVDVVLTFRQAFKMPQLPLSD